jgi:hypothetical protein
VRWTKITLGVSNPFGQSRIEPPAFRNASAA